VKNSGKGVSAEGVIGRVLRLGCGVNNWPGGHPENFIPRTPSNLE
jgi:hypothetical protein